MYNYDPSVHSGSNGFSPMAMLIWLVVVAFAVVAMWKVFVKAGKPGWAALIPIYNTLVMLEIVGRPWWWLFLFFIPFVNLVAWLIVALDMAKVFGKSSTFGVVALWLFSIVGIAILAFGSAKYVGPVKPSSPEAPQAA